MTTHFLFPSHPLKASVIDEMFAEQAAGLTDAGFTTSPCSDAMIAGERPMRPIPSASEVVYRGWMLNGDDYQRLHNAIVAANGRPITTPHQYLAAHHLPNWYPLVAEFTPETRVFPADADLERELRALAWPAFFIKDYVKSLKTSVGSIVRDPATIGTVVEEMKHFRGEIEGGFCVRRVEEFVAATERRLFVLDGHVFAPDDQPVPPFVSAIATRIPNRFFSIDVIQRRDGAWRVVELGDGQVSDLVGWSVSRFAEMWRGRANGI